MTYLPRKLSDIYPNPNQLTVPLGSNFTTYKLWTKLHKQSLLFKLKEFLGSLSAQTNTSDLIEYPRLFCRTDTLLVINK